MSVFEELTPTNSAVLASARKKRLNDVDQAWYTNGAIFMKWKADASTEKILFKYYNKWLSLKWPEEVTQSENCFLNLFLTICKDIGGRLINM